MPLPIRSPQSRKICSAAQWREGEVGEHNSQKNILAFSFSPSVTRWGFLKAAPQPAQVGALSAAVLYSCCYLVLTPMPSMAAAAPAMASLDKVILSNFKTVPDGIICLKLSVYILSTV